MAKKRRSSAASSSAYCAAYESDVRVDNISFGQDNPQQRIDDSFKKRTAVCGLADCLDEPWKGHFKSLKNQYDEVLAGPASDGAGAGSDGKSSGYWPVGFGNLRN